jgi:hypothetical protein
MHWSIRTCSKDWPRLAVLLRQKDELALFEGVAQPEGFAGPGKGFAGREYLPESRSCCRFARAAQIRKHL